MTVTQIQAGILATHVDSAVGVSLARVAVEALKSLSPEMEARVTDLLRTEIARLRSEADMQSDPVAEAAAAVLDQAFDTRIAIEA